MKAVTEDSVVRLFGSRVRKALGPELVSIRWFGSRARGDALEDSDYDLLLETRSAPTESQRNLIADIAVDISADFGILLDIHHRAADRMNKAPYSFSPFIQSVIREGVLV